MEFCSYQIEQVFRSGKGSEEKGVKDIKRNHVISRQLFYKLFPGHASIVFRLFKEQFFLFYKTNFLLLSSAP